MSGNHFNLGSQESDEFSSESDPDIELAEKLLDAVFGPLALRESATSIEALKESLPQRDQSKDGFNKLSRFRIGRLLGQGAFGNVFEAYDPMMMRSVAMKVARTNVSNDPLIRERFFREIHLSAKLNHPGIVQIYEAGEVSGCVFFVMELCKGLTLSRWLNSQSESTTIRYAASISLQIARAIAHGHEHGVIHRDLKPDNVMIQELDEQSWLVRVLDFGLAFGVEDSMRYTSSSTLMGTPLYMSPEQLGFGGAKIGPKSDIFSMGAILYELLTGCSPFAADSLPKVIDRIRSDMIVPPRQIRADIPIDLEVICMKCLRADPSQRYETAVALAEDLDAFLNFRPIKARSMTAFERSVNWLRRPDRVSEFGLGLIAINLLVLGWAVLNYPVMMCLFPGSNADSKTRDLFLPVVCLIIPVHGFMLWSSYQIYRKRLSRRVAIVHLTATILMALISITVVCLTSESTLLDMNRFERVATLGLMSTFAEVQAFGVLALLMFASWPEKPISNSGKKQT